MPEKFRANESERGGFWFWKKSTLQSKHRRNMYVPAKDIISQANDVVNKCIIGNGVHKERECRDRWKKLQAVLFLSTTVSVLGILIYYLIHWAYAIPKNKTSEIIMNSFGGFVFDNTWGYEMEILNFFCWQFIIIEVYFK